VIVVDGSAVRPSLVQASCFEEAVAFLEQEMVVDQLLPVSLAQFREVVDFSFEFSREVRASTLCGIVGLSSLHVGNTRAQRVSSEVSAHSNAGGDDHGGIFLAERRAI